MCESQPAIRAPPVDWPRMCYANSGGYGMSFGIYLAGFIILIIGLAIGAYLVHVPSQWIAVGVVCMVGLAILKGAISTRRPDA